jgi:hypothetical protein
MSVDRPDRLSTHYATVKAAEAKRANAAADQL